MICFPKAVPVSSRWDGQSLKNTSKVFAPRHVTCELVISGTTQMRWWLTQQCTEFGQQTLKRQPESKQLESPLGRRIGSSEHPQKRLDTENL